MRNINALLFFLYPLVIHTALTINEPLWAVGMLIFLSAFQFVSSLLENPINRLSMVISMLLLILAFSNYLHQAVLALYLPPLLISGTLFIVFSQSLTKSREPIISKIARLLFAENDPQILAYTRRVTLLWNIFFALIFIESALLALFTSIEVWSLFTNLLNYLFVVIVFALEYLYRRIRFAGMPRRKLQWSAIKNVNWSSFIRKKDNADTTIA